MNLFDILFSSICSDDNLQNFPPKKFFTKSVTEKRANSVDPDELAPYEPTHQSLPSLQFNYMYMYLALKSSFRGSKG